MCELAAGDPSDQEMLNKEVSQEMKTLISERGDESQPKSVMFCLIPETFKV